MKNIIYHLIRFLISLCSLRNLINRDKPAGGFHPFAYRSPTAKLWTIAQTHYLLICESIPNQYLYKRLQFSLEISVLLFFFLATCSSYDKTNRPALRDTIGSSASKHSGGEFIGGQDNKNQPRIVTYSATLNMEIEKHKMAETIQNLTKLIQTKEGVIISQTLNSVYFKVPGDNFFDMIVKVKEIGNVVYEQVSSEDVTEAYYDTKIRLENAEKFQKRYLDLLAKAKTVEESVKVEQELHRITNEIDTLKGKMNLYQNMVQYSKINVYLVEKERKGPLGWVFYAAYVGIRWLFIWD